MCAVGVYCIGVAFWKVFMGVETSNIYLSLCVVSLSSTSSLSVYQSLRGDTDILQLGLATDETLLTTCWPWREAAAFV